MDKILNILNSNNTRFSMSLVESLNTEFEISPQEFIKFAEKDLSLNYDHNIVNALSNSKRALDCQLDSLLIMLGYYKISQAKFWGFPKKIELINEIDILAPRVLKKINRQRNLLEHKFIKPSKEIVEDFLDISTLFISSTERYTVSFKPLIQLKNENIGQTIIIKNDYINESISIRFYDIKQEPYFGKIIHESVNKALASINRNKSDYEKYIEPTSLEDYSWKSENVEYKLILKEYLKYLK